MSKMGRPEKEINWQEVEKLCFIQCTQEEISAFIGVSIDTLNRRCKLENNCTFKEFFREKRQGGKISLRRSQWLKATSENNTTMQIFLGKNYLGQSDKNEISTNPDKNTITLNYKLGEINEQENE
jgi:hypothetical protein